MIRYDAWFLPDGETHLQQWMTSKNRRVEGRLTYQYHKYEAALKHCPKLRTAIDVGAHVGLWSYWMARDFAHVVAFEPKTEHVACWNLNLRERQNATLHQVALGDRVAEVGIVTGPSSSGDTAVDLTAIGTPMVPLDTYDLRDVDFIKIDCEGFEVFVLEGARETLARNRPTVIVEQKPGHGQRFRRGELDAVVMLKAMGARQVWDYAGDYVLVFPEA